MKIRGVAKSHDDAAEFMKRLNSSVFFKDVRLENTTQTVDGGLGPSHHLQPQRRGDLLMNELIAKLLKLKTPHKVAVAAGACLVIAGLYYQFFYADLCDSIANAETSRDQLREERTATRSARWSTWPTATSSSSCRRSSGTCCGCCPSATRSPPFCPSIQEQGELSGLEVMSFTVDAEVPEELYVKIPVRMEVRGGFHAITKFFKSVSELRRIVTVEDLVLTPERDRAPRARPPPGSRRASSPPPTATRIPPRKGGGGSSSTLRLRARPLAAVGVAAGRGAGHAQSPRPTPSADPTMNPPGGPGWAR